MERVMSGMSTEVEPTITLIENEDGWWTARHPALGVTSQGETREAALENLDEAVQAARNALSDALAAASDPKTPWFDH